MTIEIVQNKEVKIAEIHAEGIIITETQNALDLMAESNYKESWKMIFYEENISPDFFDLKTGMAGDILQKFSTYRCQLAIIGDFTKFQSKSLKDFIFESNKTGRIFFVNSRDEAINCLSG